MRRFACTVLAAAGLAGMLGDGAAAARIAPAAGGQIRAVVVGIDDYLFEKRLKGAVADARDLEAALRRAGVPDSNLTVLIDGAATRPALVGAMERLVEQARPNDFVLISFAGHGTQRPESVKGSKPDGKDEAFVLRNFDRSSTRRNPDLVIGPEMKHWLARLDAKNVDVLFVADTCHGGGLTREADPRAAEASYRSSAIGAAAAAELDLVSQPADAYRDESTFRRVSFLAAVDRNSKAPEVDIPGQPSKRGALSYAVARAIDGATLSRQGVIARKDLFAYARQVVSQYAQEKQTIVTEPTRGAGALDLPVWRTTGAPVAARPGVEAAAPAPTPVRVAVLNGAAAALGGVKPLFAPFTVVPTAAEAELAWDARSRDAIVASDVVARGIEATDLPAVIDRVSALGEIALMSEQRPQTIALLPDASLHHRGDALMFETSDMQDKYAVIFNVAGNGLVQFLFPRRGDAPRIASARWQLRIDEVREPFGADTVVAIVSDQPLTALEGEIKSLDNRRAAGRVPQLLRQLMPQTPATRLGFASVFTAP